MECERRKREKAAAITAAITAAIEVCREVGESERESGNDGFLF